MQKTIYIRDKESWERLEVAAKAVGVGVGAFILRIFEDAIKKNDSQKLLDDPKKVAFKGDVSIPINNPRTKEVSIRRGYQLLHPLEMCPRCRMKNRDCVCEGL